LYKYAEFVLNSQLPPFSNERRAIFIEERANFDERRAYFSEQAPA
jgi:hypothetical protein